MYIGFRAPAPGGRAFVVPVNAKAAFEGGSVTSKDKEPVRVNLGGRGAWGERDLGIRDLAAVSDGLLILAGPALLEGKFESSGRIFHWKFQNEKSAAADQNERSGN